MGEIEFWYEISNQKNYSKTIRMLTYLLESGISFNSNPGSERLGPEILITLPGENVPNSYHEEFFDNQEYSNNLRRDLEEIKKSQIENLLKEAKFKFKES